MLTAFPDFEVTVERIVGDDATAVVQWHAEGDFTGGSFQGIAPTGKHVEIRGVDVMEISAEKCATTPSITTVRPSPARWA